MNQKSSNTLFKGQKKSNKKKRALSPEAQKETLFINKDNEVLFSHKNSLELLLNIMLTYVLL